MNLFSKQVIVSLALFLSVSLKSQVPSFTITNLSSSYSITCANPSVVLTANTNYTPGPLTYSWVNVSTTLSGSNVTLTTPGVYSVTAFASPTLSSSVQIITVGLNISVPTSTLAPLSQTITCNHSSIATHSATSGDPNDTHMWLTPEGGTVFATSTPTSVFKPGGVGVYIHVAMNPVNGCATVKGFTVSSVSTFPTFSLASLPANNFTLGCSYKSAIGVVIQNALSNPTGFPVSYTLLAPGVTTTSSGPLSGANVFTINAPGLWTAVLKDNNTNCETRSVFSVTQDTTAPLISATVTPAKICPGSSVTIHANGATTYTITGGASNGVPFYPTSPFYSVTGTDIQTGCSTPTPAVVTLTIFPLPPVGINSSTLGICRGNTVTLSGTGAVSYTWANGIQDGQAFSPMFTTTYSVTGTSLQGCTNTDDITIQVSSASFNYTVNGMDLNLMNTSTGCASFFWDFGNGTTSNLKNSPVINYSTAGNYTVCFTCSTISNSCMVCTTLSVPGNMSGTVGFEKHTVESNVLLYPNPNNGEFTIDLSSKTSEGELLIFNYLGQVVYKKILDGDKEVIHLNVQKGIYHYQVYNDRNKAGSGKLIVE